MHMSAMSGRVPQQWTRADGRTINDITIIIIITIVIYIYIYVCIEREREREREIEDI